MSSKHEIVRALGRQESMNRAEDIMRSRDDGTSVEELAKRHEISRKRVREIERQRRSDIERGV